MSKLFRFYLIKWHHQPFSFFSELGYFRLFHSNYKIIKYLNIDKELAMELFYALTEDEMGFSELIHK